MSFLGVWSNGRASVSKTEDRGSIPRASGYLMACISTDRLPGYEPGDGGSTPSMPTISTGCGAADSAVGSEPEGRWFKSIRPEYSDPKLNWRSSGVLTHWILVRIQAGRFSW